MDAGQPTDHYDQRIGNRSCGLADVRLAVLTLVGFAAVVAGWVTLAATWTYRD
jgi:hypothetical protein